MRGFKALVVLLLIAGSAHAGPAAFVYNPLLTSINSGTTVGMTGGASVDTAGIQFTKLTDGTNTLTALPISSATALTGIGSPGFQWLDQASITATGGTTTSITTASTSGVRVNDICMSRAGTAANLNAWAEVTAIVTNTSITLGHALPSAVANADTFECFRSVPIIGNVGQGGTYRNAPYFQLDTNYQTAATTGLLKLEDLAAVSGDAGVGSLGVINTGVVSPAANGDYAMVALGAYGQPMASIIHDPNISAGSIATAQEDDAIANAKPVVMAGTINNRGLTTYNTTNGDAQFIGTGDYGNVMSTIFYDGAFAGARQAVGLEDAAFADQDAVVKIAGQYTSSPAQNAGTTGDISVISTGGSGGVWTQPIGGNTGGSTIASVISAASNNSTNVKGSAGTVYTVTGCNINAAVRWLKLYNKATAPTCGTDTPVMRILLPINGCTTVQPPYGANFSAGIGYCIVTGITDADNTSTAANEQTATIVYN